MKHVFVVNPRAGQGVDPTEIEAKLKNTDVDWEIYVTKSRFDAVRFVKERCESGERLRFYACGGDGTINEVTRGIIGFENASMTCVPVGSGNDFVKCCGGPETMLDIDALVHSGEKPIDVIKAGDRYCMNACHFGFDTAVASTMNKIKTKKIIGGKNAYVSGVVKALVCNMKTKGTIIADGEKLGGDEFLLCAISNGQYVGGMFKCAPRAEIDDGWLEVCYVKPVSRLTFIKLVGDYKNGNHLDNPKFKDIIIYKRCKKVEVITSEGFEVSLDGEMYANSHFTAEVMPKAVKFASPVF